MSVTCLLSVMSTSRMAVYAAYMFLFIVPTKVVTDWIELPKVTSTGKTVRNDTPATMTYLTPVLSVFTEIYETETSTPRTEISTRNTLRIGSPSLESTVGLEVAHDLVTPSHNTSHSLNDSLYVNIEAVDTDNDSSDIVEETLKEARKDMLKQTDINMSGKLEHLQNLQSKLYLQIRRFSRGIFMERQARGKKLMSFASMEGALMTIAFLTFAAFLIKIVQQFIQGLQNKDLTMTLTLPTSLPLRQSGRSGRYKRELAAAQLLQYIDEFSIKHRPHCDSK